MSITGSMISLIAWGVILLFVLLGFLLGCLRGMRKSLFFTIVFVAVLLLSFFGSIWVSKALYDGEKVWGLIKDKLPSDITAGTESATTLKEFIKTFIENKFTVEVSSGVSAGSSIVANERAMSMLDGLIIMTFRIVVLIVLYIILSIVFFLIFGLIYLIFLRPKTKVITERSVDEEGNEIVEEKEVTPKKRRLIGGIIGGAKGFIKSMVLLIPLSSIIGVAATLEISEKKSPASADAGIRLSDDSTSDTLTEIIQACKDYDEGSIGKLYKVMSFGAKKGFDDAVMDSIFRIGLKDADDIILREEIVNFAEIYNTIERNIGIDNISDYDFANNLNSQETVNIVNDITNAIGSSDLVTNLLAIAGDEGMAIASQYAQEQDEDLKYLFEELDLSKADEKWWGEQIKDLGGVYESFTQMGIDFNELSNGNYGTALNGLSTETLNNFIDSIFDIELVTMMTNGGLRYGVAKMPDDYNEVSTVIDGLTTDDGVKNELKNISKLVDIIKDDLLTDDGFSIDNVTLKTFDKILDEKIIDGSRIASTVIKIGLKTTLSDIEYDGTNVGIDKKVFEAADFSVDGELKKLVDVFEDGFGEDFSIADISTLSDTLTVGQICDMLKSKNIKSSKIACPLIENIAPVALEEPLGKDTIEGIVWVDEFTPLANVLGAICDRNAKITGIDVNPTTIKDSTITVLETEIPTSILTQRIFNKTLIDSGLIDDSDKITDWKSETNGLFSIVRTLENDDKEVDLTDLNNITSISLLTINALGVNVYKSVVLRKTMGTTLSDPMKTPEMETTWTSDNWKDEMPKICNVMATMVSGTETDAPKDRKLSVDALDDFSGIKDVTLVCLQANVPLAVSLQNMFGGILVDAGSLSAERKALITDWKAEMDALIPVAQTLENDENTLSVDALADLVFLKVETLELMKTNTHNSQTLMQTAATNMADPLETPDMNNYTLWNADKWEEEMPYIVELIKKFANSENRVVIAELDVIVGLTDAQLKTLKTTVPFSSALQNMISGKLIDNEALTEARKALITDWQAEMDGFVEVAVTLETAGMLLFDEVSDVSTISLETIKKLGVNVYKSQSLMYSMGKNMAEPLETEEMTETGAYTGVVWSSAKWQVEMPKIANVMATMVSDLNDTTKTDAEKLLNIDDMEFEGTTEIRRETFIKLNENVPTSDALQNMFKQSLYDSIYDSSSALSYPAVPLKSEEATTRNTWWLHEMEGLTNIILAMMGSDETINLDTVSDVEKIKVSVLKQLYVENETASPVTTYKSNIGKSRYVQYLIIPDLNDLSEDTVAGHEGFYWNLPTYDWEANTFNWDVEFEKVVNVMIDANAYYETDGTKTAASDDTYIDVVNADFTIWDAGDMIQQNGDDTPSACTAEQAAARNKDIIKTLSNNVDEATFLQFILRPVLHSMQGSDMCYASIYDWVNADWIREMGSLDVVSAIFMDASNPSFKATEIDLYKFTEDYSSDDIKTLCDNAPKSYMLQSMMSDALKEIGINACDTSSFTSTSTLLEFATAYTWEETSGVKTINNAYASMMEAINSKIDSFTSMKNSSTNSSKDTTEPTKPVFTFYKTAEKNAGEEVAIVTYDITLSQVTVEDGEGNNYFKYPSPANDVERVSYYTEKGTTKKAFMSSGDTTLVTAASYM